MAIIVLGLMLVGAFALLAVRLARREQPAEPSLAEIRREAGLERRRERGLELLERDTFVFVSTSSLERRLDHRIENADGREIGSSLQQPRPGRFANGAGRASRFSDVRVEICDAGGVRVVEVRRRRGLMRPLEVLDSTRLLVGTIAREGLRRRFAVTDALGRRVATIRRIGWGYTVDYVVEDETGSPLATISERRHIAVRLALARPGAAWRQVLGWGQPDEHVLELVDAADRDLRMLALGAAAAVYLGLQGPFTDNS